MLLALPLVLFAVILTASVVLFVLWIMSIIEVSKAPEPAFGPPWDNGKNPWLIGLIVSMVIPMGTIVTTILWWIQGHKALRAGQLVPKPFWSPSKPAHPYGYPPAPMPPQPPGSQPPSG